MTVTKALQLTEAEAWLAIAEILDDPAEGAGYLCNRVDRLWYRGVIDDATRAKMRARISEVLDDASLGAVAYKTNDDDENRAGRLFAALWFALDAEAEAAR